MSSSNLLCAGQNMFDGFGILILTLFPSLLTQAFFARECPQFHASVHSSLNVQVRRIKAQSI
jgi:hypothetical protein